MNIVLIDSKLELQIKLKLCITHDFLMELLSFGDNMKVIEPESLAKEIQEAHESAFNQYGE
jgi:predicted DNA-binding transcriptional regulator YafY